MTPAEFNSSVREGAQPPAGLSPALRALWWLERGSWEQGHRVAQEDESLDGAWVHAHLHRVEGDESNARYWYARAQRPPARGDLAAERATIIAALLQAPA